MKKEKMILKCTQEEFFQAMIQDFKNQYQSVKNTELPDEQVVKGFRFTKKLPAKKGSSVVNMATYRILECEYPNQFVMEYKSQRYHKVISAQTKKLDDDHIEVLFGSYDEKLGEGIKPTTDYGEDVIINVKLKTRMSIKSMLKNYRKIVKETSVD